MKVHSAEYGVRCFSLGPTSVATLDSMNTNDLLTINPILSPSAPTTATQSIVVTPVIGDLSLVTVSTVVQDDTEPTLTYPVVVETITWLKTTRGGDLLCMRGYSYRFMSESIRNNIASYRCSYKQQGCRAVVKVAIDTKTFIDTNGHKHNHPSDEIDCKKALITNIIKKRVLNERTGVFNNR
ncbi:unnamed protein product [Didymodactylos carnosus]|uniref:FLYWCH-type domain-containing protein n=1 Tax=Didymodactylos carnosus TaxID=1234261 RepID=A0A8S2IBP7_9BILA|nr:unnamed protein product [Didymodactylos carnosus]CAF3711503.1 unnamed protein product [Didymodactylos carnosus]